jgi:hypothetical protein
MGFRISYIISPAKPRDLVQQLGFQLGVETDALPYDEWWVGTLKSNGLTVFWAEAEDFVDDVASELAALSRDGEAYACRVNETVMHAQAVCYANGHEKWRIAWRGEEGPMPENLVASGSLPEGFAALLQEKTELQAQDTKTDHFFEIPLDMVSAAAGFRHDYDMTNNAFSRFFRIIEATDAPAAAQKKGFLSKLLGR